MTFDDTPGNIASIGFCLAIFIALMIFAFAGNGIVGVTVKITTIVYNIFIDKFPHIYGLLLFPLYMLVDLCILIMMYAFFIFLFSKNENPFYKSGLLLAGSLVIYSTWWMILDIILESISLLQIAELALAIPPVYLTSTILFPKLYSKKFLKSMILSVWLIVAFFSAFWAIDSHFGITLLGLPVINKPTITELYLFAITWFILVGETVKNRPYFKTG